MILGRQHDKNLQQQQQQYVIIWWKERMNKKNISPGILWLSPSFFGHLILHLPNFLNTSNSSAKQSTKWIMQRECLVIDSPSVSSTGIPPRKTFWEKWVIIWYWSIVIGLIFIGKWPRHDGIELGRPALWTTCGCGCDWEWMIGVFPRIVIV